MVKHPKLTHCIKTKKKEIHKYASSHYKCISQRFFPTKPKQRYNRIKKKCLKNIIVQIFISKRSPQLQPMISTDFCPPQFKASLPSLLILLMIYTLPISSLQALLCPQILKVKIKNIKKFSTCPLDIPIVLIKPLQTFFQNLCPYFLMKLPLLVSSLIVRIQVLLLP